MQSYEKVALGSSVDMIILVYSIVYKYIYFIC